MSFRHRGEEDSPQPEAAPAESVAAALARIGPMPLPERAAMVFEQIAPRFLDVWAWGMKADYLLLPLLPPDGRLTGPDLDAAPGLRIALYEALTALILARLVVRIESSQSPQRPEGDSTIGHAITPDGRAALQAGDVAAVVRRRLPE